MPLNVSPAEEKTYDQKMIEFQREQEAAKARGDEPRVAEPEKSLDEMTRDEKREFLKDQETETTVNRARVLTGGFKHDVAIVEGDQPVDGARIGAVDAAGFMPSDGKRIAGDKEQQKLQEQQGEQQTDFSGNPPPPESSKQKLKPGPSEEERANADGGSEQEEEEGSSRGVFGTITDAAKAVTGKKKRDQ